MPVGYFSASEVLSDELSSEALASLGSSQKVTFGASGSSLNKSEKRLPEKLVHKIRAFLDKKNLLARRIVWFDRPKSHLGDKSDAIALVRRGWPRSVVSVAMGYDPITLTRWGIPASESEPPEITMDAAVAEALGKARLSVVNPILVDRATPKKLQMIGQCLTELELAVDIKAKNERKAGKEK